MEVSYTSDPLNLNLNPSAGRFPFYVKSKNRLGLRLEYTAVTVTMLLSQVSSPFINLASIGLAEADKCTSIINLSEQNIEMSSCVSLFTERGVYILIAITRKFLHYYCKSSHISGYTI